MIKEHDCVVLTGDLPDEGLEAGDVGAVVHIHPGAAAYEVEFVTMAGQTVAIVTLSPPQVRLVGSHDMTHVREMQTK